MREIRYYIDPETDQPHIYDHGVSETEVEGLLRNAPLMQGGRRSPTGKPTRCALGRTDAGRYLKVVYAEAEDGAGIFVITAYDLRGKELLALRRRLRRRNP